MGRSQLRKVSVLVLSVVFSLTICAPSLSAATSRRGPERDWFRSIQKIVRSFGDLLTIPK